MSAIAKYITAITIIIFILIGVSGCMFNNQETSKKEQMLKYMEEKYSETFEFVNINTEVWSADYTEMILQSSKFPNNNIIVHINKKDNTISDNYIALIKSDDVEKQLKIIWDKVYNNSLIINTPVQKTLPSSYTKNMSIDDFISNIYSGVNVLSFITSSPDSKEMDVEALRQELISYNYLISFSIIYVDEATFPKINKQNYSQYTTGAANIIANGEFVIGDDGKFMLNKWR